MLLVGRSRPSRLITRVKAAVGLALTLVLTAVYSPPIVGAASTCSSTTGPGGYTVDACLSPSAGAISGTITASLTVSTSTSKARPSVVVFCLDGSLNSVPRCVDGGPGYLLRVFSARSRPSQTTSVWAFDVPTAHWVDGSHTLLAEVTMGDGTVTTPVVASLSFANGNSSQPINSTPPSINVGTVPTVGAPLVVAAVGDGAAGDPSASAVVSRIRSWSPNLFLYLGDVYQDGSYLEFTNSYDPSYGTLRSITDPVPGNHEYVSRTDPVTSSSVLPAGVAYFDYWNNLPHYYSFTTAGWHFIALDANSSAMGTAAWTAQLSWLSADLAAHPTGCTLAFWHQPAFNIGMEPVPNVAKTLWQMVAGRATLVLDGHDHTYQRWTAMDRQGVPSDSGTVEIVAGTGGHAAGSFRSTDVRVLASSTGAGAVRLSLADASASIQFVTSAGSVMDSQTVACH